MNPQPTEASVPPDSRIATQLDGASFFDAWSITSDNVNLSALDHFITAVRHTPRWIDWSMRARNRVGRLFGLKDLGTLSGVDANKPTADYRQGDRVGIFTVFENSFDEALIGDKDKHLNVVLSIHRHELPDANRVTITVTTVVHVKNLLGKIYMLPVKPMHRLIAPAVIATIGNTGLING